MGKVQNLISPLTLECERHLHHVWAKVGTLEPTWINANEWVPWGGDYDAMINLQRMTCICKKFDLEKLLCEHALRVAREIGENKFYNLTLI